MIQSSNTAEYFSISSNMATLRNKKNFAAMNRDNLEGRLRNNQALNKNSRFQKIYITQLSEKFEGRVTKKLSQESSRMQSCILSALSQVDEFFLSPEGWINSGPVPETSRNSSGGNEVTNEVRSHNDPLPP